MVEAVLVVSLDASTPLEEKEEEDDDDDDDDAADGYDGAECRTAAPKTAPPPPW
jgi:hypothetical protein